MTARKDLPRCKTCKHWHAPPDDEYVMMGVRQYGYCVNSENPEMDVPEDYGCIHHSDYDEPGTQTETNDE